MRLLRDVVRYCVQPILHKQLLLISPIKLLILLFSWVIPYLIFANYLESCLLPLRVLCYTQSDLLSTEPRDPDFQTCVDKFFPNRKADPESCKLDKIPDVLIRPDLPDYPKRILVIRSGPGSLDYRNFIRRTWKNQVDKLVPVVFVCATSKNDTLKIEANKYRDILQFDFEDSYHNLSWKMMAIYGFVIDQLPSVDQIVVTNDDTIVNATALEQVLHMKKGPVMLGKVSRGYPRIFLPWLTWHVPSEMYPNLCYPLFVQGSSFVLSKEGAKLLVENVCKVPMVHLDDVFMGVLSNCVGLGLIHNEGFDKHIFDDFVVYHYQYSRHSAKYLESLWQNSEMSL
ncbi:hypothetical protein L5515_019046 [Caenorhabditis briggsae]|uniref:Hexosyltransferase n=1 Tax=Caenorhabditis briggsae TaxID=6238 RepID=A0AAE9JT57_CAEBR|nr:hypothetical protein L3Y34_013197 [Caenorhabditis briggsae]UMM43599.1 hypothetical protein L5515_019046 [Caenorhabditis briggsae]